MIEYLGKTYVRFSGIVFDMETEMFDLGFGIATEMFDLGMFSLVLVVFISIPINV